MSDFDSAIAQVVAQIIELERERLQIYEDDQVTEEEHPRLAAIKAEIERLWDLRRRIEAAKAAGLSEVPVMPPADPGSMIG
ncbi:DUF2630 family protein [Chloroflexia bacterium SDU3-3]|nr:DUF2630 family protein [Chloroflexia bacterium SDU3-3]